MLKSTRRTSALISTGDGAASAARLISTAPAAAPCSGHRRYRAAGYRSSILPSTTAFAQYRTRRKCAAVCIMMCRKLAGWWRRVFRRRAVSTNDYSRPRRVRLAAHRPSASCRWSGNRQNRLGAGVIATKSGGKYWNSALADSHFDGVAERIVVGSDRQTSSRRR